MSTDLRDLLVGLNAVPEISRALLCRLACEPDPVFWLSEAERDGAGAAQALGVPLGALRRAAAARSQAPALARSEYRRAGELGGTLLTRLDPGYPQPFLELPLPPPVLYLQGALPLGAAIAIVGSRAAAPAERELAHWFARELARWGIVVVSGFARGIDSAAHAGALAAAGGKTVAILGCGLAVDYPRRNRALRQSIAESGAVLTEFPCAAPPEPWNFPVRNRLIAALAHGTLVVAAACCSGSLVTARHALELGREIYAIPGRPGEERAVGPNTLIRDGAQLVQHPREILESLPTALRPSSSVASERGEAGPSPPPGLSELAARVWKVLPEGGARSPEEVAAALGSTLDQLFAAFLELELGGWLHRLPGPLYARSR